MTVSEYSHDYSLSCNIVVIVTLYLGEIGFKSRSLIDTNNIFTCVNAYIFFHTWKIIFSGEEM